MVTRSDSNLPNNYSHLENKESPREIIEINIAILSNHKIRTLLTIDANISSKLLQIFQQISGHKFLHF